MKISHDEVSDLYRTYFSADKTFQRYSLNLPDDINSLDPLYMLEVINGEGSIQQRAQITGKLIEGKKVEVYDTGKMVKSFIHNGQGTLALLFTEEPYLLQVVIDYCYALVLKKLTPPSLDSEGEAVTEKA